MEELMKELNDMEIHKIDNIHIVDDTKIAIDELQKPTEPMAEPGSVRGELITEREIFSDIELKKIERREYITRVKTIAFDTLGLKLLTDPRSLPKREFNKVVKVCQEIIDSMSEEDIKNKFNDLVCTDILSEETDFTKYSIYSNKIYL